MRYWLSLSSRDSDNMDPLNLSCYTSQWDITLSMSFRRHPVFTQSWWVKVSVDQPALVFPSVVFHGRTLLWNSSLLFQQCLAYIVYLIRIVCEMRGKSHDCCCSVVCFFKEAKTVYSILVLYQSRFFSRSFI